MGNPLSVSRRVELAAYVVSLALHAALFGYVYWATSAPDLGFEFELPMEVEFGLTEAVTVSQAPSAPPEEVASTPETEEGEGASLDAGVPIDAGPPDAGRRRRPDAGPAEPVAENETTDPDAEGEGDVDGEGRGVAFLPAGSQIALRLDVARVRASPLGQDVREVLAAMPDWQALLAGSDIDPLEDLDRVLIASPNLQRSRLIVAGRATGDADAIRAAAQRLASASGETLTWETRHGVPVARWFNHDETERVIAIIGPRHFIISRAEDVPLVLAVARNRAAEEEEGEHFADALLSMRENEGLSLEVEGARNFARDRPGQRGPLEMVPTGVRLALTELPEQRVSARSRWTYDDDAQASEAAAYWDTRREAYARNPITQFLGLGGILGRATIVADGDHFDGNVDLAAAEMRRVLALARGFFQDRARASQRRRTPPDTPALVEPTPEGPAPATPSNPFE